MRAPGRLTLFFSPVLEQCLSVVSMILSPFLSSDVVGWRSARWLLLPPALWRPAQWRNRHKAYRLPNPIFQCGQEVGRGQVRGLLDGIRQNVWHI